jgi:hypothetical protein
MQLDLSDDETRALLNVLVEVIEADKYPLSPRVRLLRGILAKLGAIGGLPPELERKLRRAVMPPPALRPPR